MKRWGNTTSDACSLCRGRETTFHILSNCSVSLNSGKYLWRHNCIVDYIVKNVDTKYKIYGDIDGHRAVGGGTIPPEICITAEKPDIIIIDSETKIIHVFELTVPDIRNIDIRHQEKMNKYAHFLTDMTGYTCSVTCFEISTLGFISKQNHTFLHSIHRFIKPGIKLQKFKENISALSVYSSFHIFICRKEQDFTSPPYLSPPF